MSHCHKKKLHTGVKNRRSPINPILGPAAKIHLGDSPNNKFGAAIYINFKKKKKTCSGL